MTLQSYPVKLEHGTVRAVDGSRLPERAYAVLVILPEPAVSDERGASVVRRPEFTSLEEWRQPFEQFFAYTDAHPSEVDIETASDDELNAIVHSARDAA